MAKAAAKSRARAVAKWIAKASPLESCLLVCLVKGANKILDNDKLMQVSIHSEDKKISFQTCESFPIVHVLLLLLIAGE